MYCFYLFQFACEDEYNGVTIADGTYACAKLNDVNDRLGIYTNRISICQMKVTQCCVTCKDISKFSIIPTHN